MCIRDSIKCGDETRSMGDDTTPIDITLKQALELLKQPKRRGRGTPKKPLKELGKHPGTEKPLVVKDGRFGPYVTDGTINASIPRGIDIPELTLEEGVNLIEARAAKLANLSNQEESEKTKGKSKAKSKTKKKAKAKTKACLLYTSPSPRDATLSRMPSSA